MPQVRHGEVGQVTQPARRHRGHRAAAEAGSKPPLMRAGCCLGTALSSAMGRRFYRWVPFRSVQLC